MNEILYKPWAILKRTLFEKCSFFLMGVRSYYTVFSGKYGEINICIVYFLSEGGFNPRNLKNLILNIFYQLKQRQLSLA